MAKNGQNQFCVIGLGAYGFSLARSLAELGGYVLAIDHDIEKVEAIQQYVSEAVQFDATDPDMLSEHGVFSADIVVVAIGEAFEPVVLICMELLKAGVNRIIGRAGSDTQEAILNRIGISEVVHPEKDEGKRTAESLINTSIVDYFELSSDIAIYELDAPGDMIGYTLQELKMRQRYNINLLTIRRPQRGEIELQGENKKNYKVLGVLEPGTKILSGDRLVLMGNKKDVNKLIEIN